ncbi:MAG: SEFIR domain-containing protein [Rhodospirillales bacterium]
MPDAPKVFISYSHDGPAHAERVLELANRLREDGLDADLDQYETAPPEGWPAWCEKGIKQADFVLLVCTGTYLRRFDDEDPGKGLGVLYEARTIRQLIYGDRARTSKYIPVLLDGGSPEHIPTVVQGATRWEVETPDGYEGLYRQLTRQPKAIRPKLGAIKPMPPRQSRSGPAAAASAAAAPLPPRAAASSAPHARVADVFVGRKAQLDVLAACLLPPDAARRRPVAVTGMGGVGKSYLVDRFFIEQRAAFAGGYHRLALDAEKPGSADDLLALLADRLKLPAADDAALAAALIMPPSLLHVENIDTPEAAAVAGALAARLPGCALVFSARMGTLAAGTGWGRAVVAAFDADEALAQLRAELGPATPPEEALRPIIATLGGLPLALHLAAGHIEGGETPASLLQLLRRQGLSLAPLSPADPSFFERSHNRLEAVFALSAGGAGTGGGSRRPAGGSMDGGVPCAWLRPRRRLRREPRRRPRRPRRGGVRRACPRRLRALAARPGAARQRHRVAPASAAGRARPPRGPAGGSGGADDRLVLRAPADARGRGGIAVARGARRDGGAAGVAGAGAAGGAVGRVERAGSWFAINTGPFHAWRRFCEAALADAADDAQRSNILRTLGQVALSGGDPDEALRRAREKHDLDLARPDEREAALAAGLIADILYARGQLDDALRIRTEEQLPVYERLGDVRARAVTQRKVADILEARGELDEALRLLRNEALPAVKALGAVRDVAVFQGRIADILQARGQLDDALRIRTEEELPVYQRLG